MYNVILAIQVLGIAILIGEVFLVLTRKASKYQTILLLMLIALLINFVGAFVEITAKDAETALLGVRFSYVGKPFVVYAMFLFATYFCHIRLPRFIVVLLGIESLLASICAFTCPYHELFYTTREFVYAGAFPHLALGKGPVYIAHSVILLGVFVYFIYCCAHQLRRARTQTEKKQAYSLFFMIAICILSFVLFFSGIAGGYDTTLIGYVIAMIILIHSVVSHNLFDALTIASEQSVIDYRDGLVAIDQFGDLVLINKVAASIALDVTPQLAPLVDIVRDNSNPNEGKDSSRHFFEVNRFTQGIEDMKNGEKALADLVQLLHDHAASEEPLFAIDEVIRVHERKIDKRGTHYGTAFELNIVTESYNYATRLEHDVREKTREIRDIQRQVTAGFADMVEARDGTTGTHIVNTSKYVKMIAEELVTRVTAAPEEYDEDFKKLLDPWYLTTIVDAAPLHDLGKLAVPDAILTKPGKLTPEEFEEIKKHSQAGADLIEKVLRGIESDDYVEIASRIALGHHEWWDGTGYPNGAAGSDIPLCARIMAVADVYDALRAERQYKKPFAIEKSLSIIKEESGSHFDPQVAEAFMAAIEREEAQK